MKNMKKVEIIIESVYINIQGAGGHGRKTADDVTDVFSNDYIFTVCEEEAFLKMQPDITNFIKEYGGKCIVSDAMLLI